jgi:hypothetical protein
LSTRLSYSEADRNRLIDSLIRQNQYLATRHWRQSSQLRALNSRIATLEQLPDAPKRTPPPPDDQESSPSRVPEITDEHKRVLFMFYNGHDIDGVCKVMNLPPGEIFRLLQSVIVAPSFQLPDAISVPHFWELDKKSLLKTIDEFEFLFSPMLRESFDWCQDAADFAAFLVQAFADFSQQDRPDWAPMAIFILEMAVKNVMRSLPQYEDLHEMGLQEKVVRLEQRIAALKSLKGKLLHDIRAKNETPRQYESDVRVRASRAQAADRGLVDLNTVVSSDSSVRAAVFRE